MLGGDDSYRDQMYQPAQHHGSQGSMHSGSDMNRPYDPQVPIDSMQGLDIGSHHGGSQYGHMENMPDLGPQSASGDLNFETLESSLPPQAQQDGAQPGMQHSWYDTDL